MLARSLKLGNVVPLLLAVAACWPVYFAAMSARHFLAPSEGNQPPPKSPVLPPSSDGSRGASVADTDDEVLYINHLQRQHCEPS